MGSKPKAPPPPPQPPPPPPPPTPVARRPIRQATRRSRVVNPTAMQRGSDDAPLYQRKQKRGTLGGGIKT